MDFVIDISKTSNRCIFIHLINYSIEDLISKVHTRK
jgi:hypothetical protein